MTDYFLKAADESAMWEALESAGMVDEECQPVGIALDIIGTIYKPTGEVDAEGLPAMAPIPGFHANIRGELTAEQAAPLPLIQPPNNPARVWT